ncbi:MAG: hypothetical protein NT109_00150 [Flavobacteriia bacterium]|nr:hypothetical protein [Flavobacteriia bacterium]
MVKTNKLKSVLVVVARIVAFIAVCCLLFFQLNKKSVSIDKLSIIHFWPLILTIFLVPINWLLEYNKWLILLTNIGEQRNDLRKPAFYAGMVTGLLTPAMAGNFLGRIYYFNKSKRWKLTIHTSTSNFSQFLISMFFGGLAFLFLSVSSVFLATNFQVSAIVCIVIITCVLYFFGESFIRFFPLKRLKLIAIMLRRGPSRIQLLLLSFFRYLIFLLQFSLCLYAFSGFFSAQLVAFIALVFMAVTLSPSLFLGKIVVRESIAVAILGLAGLAPIPVLLASLTTWFFNLILPTLWAALKIKR